MINIRNASLLALPILLGFCAGCQLVSPPSKASDNTEAPVAKTVAAPVAETPIETVRNGSLQGFDTTSVGKAFEGTFENAKWSSFETKKGVTVVQFEGTISAHAVRQSGFVVRCETDDCPVTFQFTMSADKTSFTLAYVDDMVFLEDHTYRVEGYGVCRGVAGLCGTTKGSVDPASQEKVLQFVYR